MYTVLMLLLQDNGSFIIAKLVIRDHKPSEGKNSGRYTIVTKEPVCGSMDHDTTIDATAQSTLTNTQTLPSAACVACQGWPLQAPQASQGEAETSPSLCPTPQASYGGS